MGTVQLLLLIFALSIDEIDLKLGNVRRYTALQLYTDWLQQTVLA